MKKIIIVLLLFLAVYNCNAQFSTSVGAYRVVFVSPNYPNIYPRYTKLENVWNAIKDSASVSTGKYFVINATTAYNNITDWTSGYKDSIINRDPYMKLTAFGQAVNDSIIGVTAEEFQLVAGILSLNSLTAGDGLSFPSHTYKVNVDGETIVITNDTLAVNYNSNVLTYQAVPGYLTIKLNGGLFETSSGIQLRVRSPFYLDNDTLDLKLGSELYVTGDSLCLGYSPDAFTVSYGVLPSFTIKYDSGLTVPISGNGIKVTPDWGRIVFNSSGKLTLPSLLAGYGLKWIGDSLNILPAFPLVVGGGKGDSLFLLFNIGHFDTTDPSNGLSIRLDSGITSTSSGIKPKIDYATLIFNTALQLVVNPLIAGSGLVMTSGVIDINYNDFATVSNDTLKIRTSTLLMYRWDSLNTSVSYDVNADTIGYGMSANGKIKRVSISYVTDAGNDTTVMYEYSYSFSKADRIAMRQYSLGTALELLKNGVTVTTLALPDLTTPYLRRVNVATEIWQEAL